MDNSPLCPARVSSIICWRWLYLSPAGLQPLPCVVFSPGRYQSLHPLHSSKALPAFSWNEVFQPQIVSVVPFQGCLVKKPRSAGAVPSCEGSSRSPGPAESRCCESLQHLQLVSQGRAAAVCQGGALGAGNMSGMSPRQSAGIDFSRVTQETLLEKGKRAWI